MSRKLAVQYTQTTHTCLGVLSAHHVISSPSLAALVSYIFFLMFVQLRGDFCFVCCLTRNPLHSFSSALPSASKTCTTAPRRRVVYPRHVAHSIHLFSVTSDTHLVESEALQHCRRRLRASRTESQKRREVDRRSNSLPRGGCRWILWMILSPSSAATPEVVEHSPERSHRLSERRGGHRVQRFVHGMHQSTTTCSHFSPPKSSGSLAS